jgi:hypothetical protein
MSVACRRGRWVLRVFEVWLENMDRVGFADFCDLFRFSELERGSADRALDVLRPNPLFLGSAEIICSEVVTRCMPI